MHRAARLTQAIQYRQVFRAGRRRATKFFNLITAPRITALATAESARLGMAIAKRIVPRAIDRNRIKRLVRESFRQHHAVLPPLDIVVTARPLIRNATNEAITRTLNEQWRYLCDESKGMNASK
ncbi:MAG: ribonuclease P protein component [Gammaproteobacteria bacterium]|nr:ribonuclease P protein component [Gammaproteobacteria bacterium]